MLDILNLNKKTKAEVYFLLLMYVHFALFTLSMREIEMCVFHM